MANGESILSVKWPWVLGVIFGIFAWLFTLSYANTVNQERRITAAEEQIKAMTMNVSDIKKITEDIRRDQAEFLKEFYKRLK